MNEVAQFLVELSWAMSMGMLLSLGALVGQILAFGLIALAMFAVGRFIWKRVRRN
jgi:hypothetical protein